MVTGNNNSIKLIELFCGFHEIIYGKQLEQYMTCNKGSTSNNNDGYHILSIYKGPLSVLSVSQHVVQSHEALKWQNGDLNLSVLLTSAFSCYFHECGSLFLHIITEINSSSDALLHGFSSVHFGNPNVSPIHSIMGFSQASFGSSNRQRREMS